MLMRLAKSAVDTGGSHKEHWEVVKDNKYSHLKKVPLPSEMETVHSKTSRWIDNQDFQASHSIAFHELSQPTSDRNMEMETDNVKIDARIALEVETKNVKTDTVVHMEVEEDELVKSGSLMTTEIGSESIKPITIKSIVNETEYVEVNAMKSIEVETDPEQICRAVIVKEGEFVEANSKGEAENVAKSDKTPDHGTLESTLEKHASTVEGGHESSEEDPFATDGDDDPDFLPDENKTINMRKRLNVKKRKSDPAKWHKKIAKERRNLGLAYTSTSSKKKKIAPRKMGQACGGCKFQCITKFSEEERAAIFAFYWKLGDLQRQRDFLGQCMDAIERGKYNYVRVNDDGSLNQLRGGNHAFYFKKNGEKRRVCKPFFRNTLGINDRPIRTVISKMSKTSAGIDIEGEKRGKHGNCARSVEEGGHTQNKGDLAHSLIEKKVKLFRKASPIFHPDQYFSLMRGIKIGKKNFQVLEMSYKDFLNLKSLPDVIPQRVIKIRDLRIIHLTTEKVEYTDSFGSEYSSIPIKRRTKGKVKVILPAYTEKPKINEKKKTGIMSLFEKNIIRSYYRPFYESL
ncbi:unnamed protein product [Diabrotica balteata]|uniref:Uncharacterized protein n=1 Tax=Diabrotica balteata TaxID=107213 RepID=A0A9N9ST79_DIABA|nr:unnamed protein product [Diabrotica balteata]